MAELVLSAFFTVFFEKLASEALQKLARSKGITSQLKKLKRSLIQIKALLNDASEKEVTDEAVKEWLNGLQHLAYDIDDLLDDLETKAMHREFTTSKVRKLIPTSCTNFLLCARMHGKLDNITTKLREIVEEKNNLGLRVKGESPRHKNRKLQTSLVVASRIVGREGDKDLLLHKLLRDDYEPSGKSYGIMPIVGMGGLGKTTLARLLYDEMQGKGHFELMAWLQVALKEKISGKRFLIVLDDVWSESYTDWENLERPFLAGAPRSKIIMTTRKSSLLNQLGYNQPYRLAVLSHDNALSLFCEHALGENNFDSHPTLKLHGEGIVEKCDGLPLALIALGRLLRTKTDEEEWEEMLNSEIWRLGKRDEIVPALRLSYHELSAPLKLLFAYCSLFPKDYLFDKEELILFWMGEGFLHQATTRKSMERLGLEYFEELSSRSFFQQSPNNKLLFVMHDLMHDLATSVAGVFFLMLDIEMKKDHRKGEALEKYRHMSFVYEPCMDDEMLKAFQGAKSLRTFLAFNNKKIKSWPIFYISNKILVNLLHELPLIRVLSLSQLYIIKVPESIGSLKHLRYLNLSQTDITYLPDNVCNLSNLQTLIVSGCPGLKELPNNFSNLKKLRHFVISDTPLLTKMPLGIGELKSLQTLSKFIIEGENGLTITDLKDLKDLRGKISIKGLDKVQCPMQAEEASISQKRIHELKLEWSDVFDGSRKKTLEKEVLIALNPSNDHLKKLEIVSYGGREFPNWVGDPSFLRLAHVSIHGCKKCASLPLLGQLPSLKTLFIRGMDEVKDVGLEFLGATSLVFQSLETLCFEDMQGWEVWLTNNGGVVNIVFPCLKELSLNNCPNLVKVSLEALPSLRVLKIRRCYHGVLTSLVRIATSVTKLGISYITGLDNQVWGDVILYLGAVEEIEIAACDEIRYWWESKAHLKVLVNLRKMRVSCRNNSESLGENVIHVQEILLWQRESLHN